MSEASPLTLTDPAAAPTYGDSAFSRWCQSVLHDKRDEVFIRLTYQMLFLMVALMGGLYAALRFAPVSVTHGADVLAAIADLVTINSAMEVDLFGQVFTAVFSKQVIFIIR